MNTQLTPGAMVTGTVPQVVVCLKSPEVVIAVTISGSVPLLTRVIVSGELGVLRTTWPKSRLLMTVPPYLARSGTELVQPLVQPNSLPQ